MSVRILHMADAHLGAPLANFGEYAGERRKQQAAAFERAIDVAIEEAVHAVVIAGDLFDTFAPEAETVNAARRQLGRLKESGVPVFAVPGTHDSLAFPGTVYRTETLPFTRLFDEQRFAEPARVEVDGTTLHVYGMAYVKGVSGRAWESLQRTAEGGIHVALVHAACRVNPEWSIPDEDMPFDESDLPGFGMDYVALGHYHNMRLFTDGDRVVGAYSGSLEGRDWTELGPRHVLVVSWAEPGGAPDVREVEVQSKRLESGTVDLTGVHDPDAVALAIREVCDTDRLWQVTLGGNPEFAPDVESIASTLTAAYGYIDVRDGTSLAESHVLAERCEEETVRGEFFRRLMQARSTAPDDREKEVAERAIKIGLAVFG